MRLIDLNRIYFEEADDLSYRPSRVDHDMGDRKSEGRLSEFDSFGAFKDSIYEPGMD